MSISFQRQSDFTERRRQGRASLGIEVFVRERSRSLEVITSSLSTNTNRFDWLDFNPAMVDVHHID